MEMFGVDMELVWTGYGPGAILCMAEMTEWER